MVTALKAEELTVEQAIKRGIELLGSKSAPSAYDIALRIIRESSLTPAAAESLMVIGLAQRITGALANERQQATAADEGARPTPRSVGGRIGATMYTVGRSPWAQQRLAALAQKFPRENISILSTYHTGLDGRTQKLWLDFSREDFTACISIERSRAENAEMRRGAFESVRTAMTAERVARLGDLSDERLLEASKVLAAAYAKE